MAFLPLRQVPLPPDTASAYDGWLQRVADELDDPACDRWELCRQVLTEIYYPQLVGADVDSLPAGARIALLQMDARNITLEPEYYSDIDPEKYARVKPLIWLWEMFDKSPLGENVHLGVKFRRILARHIFRRCGRNFKCFHFVKLSFGYNIEVGDGVVVHRHVLLDDRGGIVLGNKVSVADFANIYSHTHELGDQRDVHSPVTVLGDGARVTYHATILSGSNMQPDSMVGALAVVTKDVESGVVAVGIPAQPRFNKPKVDERPAHPATKDPLADPA
jgi:acetyltransferase-like isoleucine patch superfamily enzyme